MEWAAGVSQRLHLTPRIPSLEREHRTDELISWGWIHGVHSVPSLKQLHVHVMTLDLNSPCMKMLGLQNTSQWPHVFCSDAICPAMCTCPDMNARNAKHFSSSTEFMMILHRRAMFFCFTAWLCGFVAFVASVASVTSVAFVGVWLLWLYHALPIYLI